MRQWPDFVLAHTERFLVFGFLLTIIAGIVLVVLILTALAASPAPPPEIPTPVPTTTPIAYSPTPTSTSGPVPTPTAMPRPTATPTPRPTPTATPSPTRTPTPTFTPTPEVGLLPESCSFGVPETYPNVVFLGAESEEALSVLSSGGSLRNDDLGWTVDGRDMSSIRSAQVFATDAPQIEVQAMVRRLLADIGWQHITDLPEFGFLLMGCLDEGTRLSWGYFGSSELTPLSIPNAGFVLVVYR